MTAHQPEHVAVSVPALAALPLLVAGPPAGLRAALVSAVRAELGCSVVSVSGLSAVLAVIAKRRFAAAVVELPAKAPADLAAGVSALQAAVPALLLVTDTAMAQPLLAAPAAPEIMVRPVRLAALLGWVERCVASPPGITPEIQLGPFILNPLTKQLYNRQTEQAVRLTEKEVGILQYLSAAGDALVTREALLAHVWGYRSGIATHTLETHIYRLRRKIEQNSGKADLLISTDGGYRLGCSY